MATDTLKAGIPQLTLAGGMQIVFEAISPTTGATVAGVIVRNVAIYADDLTALQSGGLERPRLVAGFLPGG
jgi:hypothetical protein